MSVAMSSGPQRPAVDPHSRLARSARKDVRSKTMARLLTDPDDTNSAPILPGTPAVDRHEREMELARARKKIAAQQTRLRSFEDLLEKVKIECDERERSKSIKGFPTPQRNGHIQAFSASTPVQKLTRADLSEANPLMRTPKSLPFTYAWDSDGDDDAAAAAPPAATEEYIDVAADGADAGPYVECGASGPEYAVPAPVGTDTEYVEIADDAAGDQLHYVELLPAEPTYAVCADGPPADYMECGAAGDTTQYAAVVVPEQPPRAGPRLAPAPGRNAVHCAAACGDIARLTKLVDFGWPVDCGDHAGRTPLMYALRFGRLRAAQWLCAHGAVADAQTKDQSTALHYACFQGTEAAVRFLAGIAKANARLPDDEGRTPLHWCMHNRSVKVLDALLTHSNLTAADVNGRDSTGMTPAMWACFYDSTDHLERLVALGADMACVDVEGKSAMHWTVRSQRTRCLRKLLTYENSFDMDAQGRSIVHHAAEVGNVKAIRVIAAVRPQSIHDVDDKGRSPLHWATVCRHVAAVQALVKLGAYVARKDSLGKSALAYAVEQDFAEGEEVLRAAEKYAAYKPRLGPADASTSLRAFDMPVPAGFLAPSKEAQKLFKMLRVGTYLWKFTNEGKGTLHRRYFWLDCFTGELCWCKSPEAFAKSPGSASSEYIVDVEDAPTDRVRARDDYAADGDHRWAFTLQTYSRTLDVVAKDVVTADGTVIPAEQIYRTWIDGLRCLKVYGEHILRARGDSVSADDSAASDDDPAIRSMLPEEDV